MKMQSRNQLVCRVHPVVIGALLAGGFTEASALEAPGQPPTAGMTATAPPATANALRDANKMVGQDESNTKDSNATQLQTVVVTGIRASSQSARARKRNAPQILESIVAQNVGKLPDTNAADALQRITGVQAVQGHGEGSAITIRGLTQIETQLNGNTVFTASGNRSLNFEDIPAGLLAGIDVYKTPLASQIEGGIGICSTFMHGDSRNGKTLGPGNRHPHASLGHAGCIRADASQG